MASARKKRKARPHAVVVKTKKPKKTAKGAKRNSRPKRKSKPVAKKREKKRKPVIRRRPVRRKRKPASLSKQVKKLKAELAATKQKLRQARVKRRVQLLKQRAKRRRDAPGNIKLLPGLDEYSRRRMILDILSTANDSEEYWELVQQIADELEITTYLVASVASPPRGGVFHVAA